MESSWILDVARITEKLMRRMARAINRSERVSFLRDQDIELQHADREYASRAGSNNVHFLLPRTGLDTKQLEYLIGSLEMSEELNALSVYAWFHYRALSKISLLYNESLRIKEKQRLAIAALADEAFAQRFLEDVFAAGHVAGTWGSTSLRKGTHDYYNEHGLETTTCNGDKIVLLGDAYMRPEEAVEPAEGVRKSIEQFIHASEGRGDLSHHVYSQINGTGLDLATADSLNICSNNFKPLSPADAAIGCSLYEVIKLAPIPIELNQLLISDFELRSIEGTIFDSKSFYLLMS